MIHNIIVMLVSLMFIHAFSEEVRPRGFPSPSFGGFDFIRFDIFKRLWGVYFSTMQAQFSGHSPKENPAPKGWAFFYASQWPLWVVSGLQASPVLRCVGLPLHRVQQILITRVITGYQHLVNRLGEFFRIAFFEVCPPALANFVAEMPA